MDEQDGNGNRNDEDDPIALLRRFEPILRFNEGELFLPAAVEDYVRCCELFRHDPGGRRELIAEKGTLTIERLVELAAGHPRPGQYLRFVDEPFTRTQIARWRLRSERPRFHNASRLARVGVMSRGIDALSRASLMFRGKVAGGTEAAAEVQYRTEMRAEHHPYYGRVLHDGGYTVLQYWYFYVFNDWRSRVYGVNDHEADWEQIAIYLTERDGEWRAAWIASSAHDEVGDDLRRRWDDPDLTLVGDHPVIFPGLGSHSGACIAGEYLTAYEGDAFAPMFKASRRVSRLLLPWTRDQDHLGLSIPYIDYSRGDGVGIGSGEKRSWEPVLIDETTPWVVHYRGLWGDDTQDPLGGERGPAGPRYERSAFVRTSWGDPVGWAGLRKVPPGAESGATAVSQRLAELDEEIVTLSEQIGQRETRLRAIVASGERVAARDEAELSALSVERVTRRDERLVLAGALDRAAVAAAPHDHLRHRRLPLPAESKARRRVLAIWSALSTPFVLAVAAVFLIDPGWTSASVGIEVVVAVFAIEALARGQLARFVMLIATALLVLWVALAIAGKLVDDWRLAVGIPLILVAAALTFLNVRELLRD